MEEFSKDKYMFSKAPSILDVSAQAIKLRDNQISLMVKELFLYKVLLADLVKHIPSNSKRNLILNIAYFVVGESEILEKFKKNRILPFKAISKHTHVTRSFLDSWQEYIITYIVILSNPNYKNIQDYLKVEYTEENNEDSTSLVQLEHKQKYCGMVIKKSKYSNVILTSDGRFIRIKKVSDPVVGVEVEGIQKTGIKNLGIKLAILAVILMFIGISAYRQYSTPVTTVLVATTSDIKFEVNKYDKVIYCYSSYDKGKELINEVHPTDMLLDDALEKCLEYANDNEMIPSDGILITVNGKALEYGELVKTGTYVVDKELDVLINNAGNQHKLKESILRERNIPDETEN